MRTSSGTLARVLLGIGLATLLDTRTERLQACDEPVFRWALEHWGAHSREECYEATVFHRGELEGAAAEAVAALRKSSWTEQSGEEGSIANLAVRTVDVSGEIDEASKVLWGAERAGSVAEGPPETAPTDPVAGPAREPADPPLPWLVLRYPPALGIPVDVWSGPLDAVAAERILDSPLRRKIVERVLKGDAAVWVLLECGDASKDAAAAAVLERRLKELEKTIELPEAYDAESAWDLAVPAGGGASGGAGDVSEPARREPERPVFSLERISQAEIARPKAPEAIFLRMLLRTEADLAKLSASEPVAFPIFARGRVLYALVGKGITDENVEEACGYIVGRCSCEFKWMNPGVDMLMLANWESVPRTPAIRPAELLTLVAPPSPPGAERAVSTVEEGAPAGGNAPVGEGSRLDAPAAAAGAEAEASDGGSGSRTALLRNVAIALGVIVLVIAVSAIGLRRRFGPGRE